MLFGKQDIDSKGQKFGNASPWTNRRDATSTKSIGVDEADAEPARSVETTTNAVVVPDDDEFISFFDGNKEYSLELITTQDSGNFEDERMMINMFGSVFTQMMLECGNEVIMKKVFESVSTQMKSECGDGKSKKNKFESVSTQMMMLRGEDICFPMNNSVIGLLEKYTDVNVLQLVIDKFGTKISAKAWRI